MEPWAVVYRAFNLEPSNVVDNLRADLARAVRKHGP